MTDWRMLVEAEGNSVVYPEHMAADLDELREIGEAIRKNEADREALVKRRDELARKLRSDPTAPQTWRALAAVLEMTEHGLIKSVNRK